MGNKKTPQSACGVKKSKWIRSTNRRDSRKPPGDEAAHADDQWNLTGREFVNHGRDYNRRKAGTRFLRENEKTGF